MENIAAGRAKLDIPELYQCVHCGLCLNQCPTYRLLQLETESPRGRIHLVKALAEGRLEPNNRLSEHLYLCLMCRACESACPSGVHFGRIAETARSVVPPPGSALARAITQLALNYLLPSKRRLKIVGRLLRLYQLSGAPKLEGAVLPKRLKEIAFLLPPVPAHFFMPEAEIFPAVGQKRARVGLLSGCAMSLLFGPINEATVRVLNRNGCEVFIPKNQECCGALHIHNGEKATAQRLARINIDAFLSEKLDAVIINAAGCGAAVKEYGHLLRDDPDYKERAESFADKARDISEFLSKMGLLGSLGRIEMTVTYQDPCHLAHGQRVREAPRQLLHSIPGLNLVEMEASDRCCGSAGIYNLTHPEISRELLKEKMAFIAKTSARAVVAPNPGCMLQLGYGARRYGPPVEILHLIDLLDRAYRSA